MKGNIKDVEDCELIRLYEFLGKRWTTVILHNIDKKGITFNKLHSKTGKSISPILLSSRLKAMQKFNIIKKKKIAGRLVYILSEEGAKLFDILHEIKKWAIKQNLSLLAECKNGRCICENKD